MIVALLAESRIPFEILFFLMAGVITLISKLAERAKKAREQTIREEKQGAAKERMVLPGMEPDVRQPPPLAPSVPTVIRRRHVSSPTISAPTISAPTISAPTVSAPPMHKRGTVSRRTHRKRPPPMPVPVRGDPHYRRQSVQMHPVVRRLRGDRNALRDAILLREIFGPPVAMRGRHQPGNW